MTESYTVGPVKRMGEPDPDEEHTISFTLDEIGDLIYVAELGSVGLGNEPQVLIDLRGIFEELNGIAEA